MARRDWKIEGYNANIWRNKYNPSLTVEIWDFNREEEREIGAKYYGFPAINGKGIESSPDFFQTRKEAENWARDYMRTH